MLALTEFPWSPGKSPGYAVTNMRLLVLLVESLMWKRPIEIQLVWSLHPGCLNDSTS